MIGDVSASIADPELAWLFGNCFANTLDTTVTFTPDHHGKPDTFVITGDIDAMWLRDSTNQVWPYLPLINDDPQLRAMFVGLIHRQAACVRIDPYANAFYAVPERTGHWANDKTVMRPGVHERKYELDTLCAVLRLAIGYYDRTHDASPFDADWLATAELIVQTIRHEQQDSDEQPEPAYRFQRNTESATDTLPNRGLGSPTRRTGMSRSPFRPSDDAGTFQYLIPANAYAVVVLRDLADMLKLCNLAPALQASAASLAEEINRGIRQHGIIRDDRWGAMYAYEVDGFGSHYLMDDANVPSLLSLPYLGYGAVEDPIYQNTRSFILSDDNPYFFQGKAGEGVGGPHVGLGWIWPMSITMRALTSTDEDEIVDCLRQLVTTHAGTGFIHEAFWKHDANQFTRKWFAWANTLFGELVYHLYRARPHLLKKTLK